MMTDKTVDANPRRRQVNWKLIDWITVKRTVRRLQERIVKAFKQKDYRKVKDLQRLYVHPTTQGYLLSIG